VAAVATGDWADDAHLDQWQSDTCQFSGKCGGATWPRHGQPRGTQSSNVWQVKKLFWGSWVLNPRPPPSPSALTKRPNTNTPCICLVYISPHINIYVDYIVKGAKGRGLGLSPSPWSLVTCHISRSLSTKRRTEFCCGPTVPWNAPYNSGLANVKGQRLANFRCM
jgi:hypothetical protein